VVADLGVELTREHRLRQIRNAAAVAAMAVELGRRWRSGLVSDAELVTGVVGAEATGYEAAVRMAGDYMTQHRALVAHDLLDVPLVVPEFDAAGASARALSTLEAFQRLRSAELPQHVADREFWRIVGNLGVWSDKATQMVSRGVVIESAGYAGSRWRRVTDGNPCAFCAMLAGRGPVYLTRESAGRVVGREMGRGNAYHKTTGKVSYGGVITRGKNAGKDRRRGTQDIGERYHDHCGCAVEEVAGDWAPTAEEQRFVTLYEDALALLADRGDIASTSNILYAMRELGNGIIHDARKPQTQTGGGSSGGGANKPPLRSSAEDPGERPKRARIPRERTNKDEQHWRARQDALPFETSGTRMKPHEIEFAEAFQAAGYSIERWLPQGGFNPRTGKVLPECDFIWNGKRVELKRSNNLQTIKDHIKSGLKKGKSTFMVDFGEEKPPDRVLRALAGFTPEAGNPEIWAFWSGTVARLK